MGTFGDKEEVMSTISTLPKTHCKSVIEKTNYKDVNCIRHSLQAENNKIKEGMK